MTLRGGQGTSAGGRIDFDAVRRSVDLRKLVESVIGPPLRGGRWACPIHQGDGPNFAITPDGLHFRCFTCGASGDAVDFLVAVENITPAEAAGRLDPYGTHHAGDRRPARSAAPAVTATKAAAQDRDKPAAWQDPEWQSAVEQIVAESERTLWSPEGAEALGWLRDRGLADDVIRRFRIGLNVADRSTKPIAALGPDRFGRPRGIRVSRGVVLPWVRPDSWYCAADDEFGDPGSRFVGCNVRRFPEGDLGGPHPSPKYLALVGSERGHGYPHGEPSMPGCPAIVAEGELDSLVGYQEFGWVANIVSFGGASQRLRTESAREYLDSCGDVLILFDEDDAGDQAARELPRQVANRCRRLYLPAGFNDLNDLHLGGELVIDWLRGEYEEFGLPWPGRDQAPPSKPAAAVESSSTWLRLAMAARLQLRQDLGRDLDEEQLRECDRFADMMASPDGAGEVTP